MHQTPPPNRRKVTPPQSSDPEESFDIDDNSSASPRMRSSHDSVFTKARNILNMPSSQRYQRLGLDASAGNTTRGKTRSAGILYYALMCLAAFGGCALLASGILTFVFSGGPSKQLAVFARLPEWVHSGDKLGALALKNDNYPTDTTRDIIPIRCHSHNDYWRRVPLLEALHYGCIGVEADVWSRSGFLFVGHSSPSLTRARTFKGLYIEPLLKLLDKQNPRTDFFFQDGRRHGVFDTDADQTLVLLVDFKTDGHKLLPLVLKELEPLRARRYLTHYNGSHVLPGPITVVGTGNAPFELISEADQRDIFFDAPLDKLEVGFLPSSALTSSESSADTKVANVGAHDGVHKRLNIKTPWSASTPAVPAANSIGYDVRNSYYASTDFAAAIGPVSGGRLTDKQLAKIRAHVKAASERELKSRYWGVPSWPISTRNYLWRTLMEAGVDMLSVDDLPAAALLEW